MNKYRWVQKLVSSVVAGLKEIHAFNIFLLMLFSLLVWLQNIKVLTWKFIFVFIILIFSSCKCSILSMCETFTRRMFSTFSSCLQIFLPLWNLLCWIKAWHHWIACGTDQRYAFTWEEPGNGLQNRFRPVFLCGTAGHLIEKSYTEIFKP